MHWLFVVTAHRTLVTSLAALTTLALGTACSSSAAPPPTAPYAQPTYTQAPPPPPTTAAPPPPLAAPFPWLGGQLPPLLTPQGWGLPIPAPVPTAAASWSQEEWDVVQLVNGYRARGAFCAGQFYGPAAPLSAHPALQRAARAHSWDMGQRNFYSHQTPDGHGPSDRVRAAGYPGGAAENIHVQVTTAHAVVDDWMKSSGHCKNFMNPAYREIGVGHAQVPGSHYGDYWTANMGFGSR